MPYDVNFGRLAPAPRPVQGNAFRLAVLGDFSGRASKGVVETGKALAARKPLRVDVDNLDDVLARLAPRIVIPLGDEGTVEIPIASMDDFHPDQLAEALPLFEELLTLRRNLQSRAGFDRAAKEVLSWAGAEPLAPPETRRPRGGAIATDRRLTDFARLTGRPAAAEASTDDLVRRLIGPFIVPATDSRQEALVARVDAALSDAMRRVLHHPEFQAAEALWRGVEMLVRGLETGARLQIVLYDISAEELAADLAAADSLNDSALYSLLIEQPSMDESAGPISFIAGLYGFELAPPHADLLGRMAQLAGAAGAPFVAGIGPDALRIPRQDWHPMVQSAWAALQALSASAYLGLASPRFLLRMPYGKRTDPIDAFTFEEFTRQSGLGGMLWGNPALLVAQLAGQSWLDGGKTMTLGSHNVVGDLPVYVYHDADGDQVALPCTERLFTERAAQQVASTGVVPVVSLRGRPEVRVAGFASLAGTPLAGRWAPVDVKPPAPPAAAPTPPAPAPEPIAAAPEKPEPEPQVAAPAADDSADLDALLADLAPPAPPPAAAAPAEDDLDALLASLSAEPPPAAADATDVDLDALLASLK
jgi:type VI secretion system protein ImpC